MYIQAKNNKSYYKTIAMALKDFHKTGNSCFKEEIIHFISLFLIVCLMRVWCKTNMTIFTLHLITAELNY